MHSLDKPSWATVIRDCQSPIRLPRSRLPRKPRLPALREKIDEAACARREVPLARINQPDGIGRRAVGPQYFNQLAGAQLVTDDIVRQVEQAEPSDSRVAHGLITVHDQAPG